MAQYIVYKMNDCAIVDEAITLRIPKPNGTGLSQDIFLGNQEIPLPFDTTEAILENELNENLRLVEEVEMDFTDKWNQHGKELYPEMQVDNEQASNEQENDKQMDDKQFDDPEKLDIGEEQLSPKTVKEKEPKEVKAIDDFDEKEREEMEIEKEKMELDKLYKNFDDELAELEAEVLFLEKSIADDQKEVDLSTEDLDQVLINLDCEKEALKQEHATLLGVLRTAKSVLRHTEE